MIKKIFFLLIIVGAVNTSFLMYSMIESTGYSRYPLYIAAVAGGYYLNKWWTRPDTTEPQLDIVALKLTDKSPDQKTIDMRTLFNDVAHKKTLQALPVELSENTTDRKHILATKGIPVLPDDDTIMVLSQGGHPSNKPNGLLSAHKLFKNHIIPEKTVCVTYNPQDDRRRFAFGTGIDGKALQVTHQNVSQYRQPQIYVGECLGGYKVLRLASEQCNDINNLILLSPSFSAKRFIDGLGRLYVAPFFGKWACKLLPSLMEWYFPSYKASLDTLESELKTIKNKNILIIHHEDDPMLPLEDVRILINKLKQNNNCYLHVCHNLGAPKQKHGIYLVDQQDCKEVINAFYEENNLPYFPELAQNGKELLEKAKITNTE